MKIYGNHTPHLKFIFANNRDITVSIGNGGLLCTTLPFYVDENYLMDKYFIHSSTIKKNKFILKNKNELKNLDKFYFICFNHPEMHVGKNKKIQDNNKCDVQIENFNSWNWIPRK